MKQSYFLFVYIEHNNLSLFFTNENLQVPIGQWDNSNLFVLNFILLILVSF